MMITICWRRIWALKFNAGYVGKQIFILSRFSMQHWINNTEILTFSQSNRPIQKKFKRVKRMQIEDSDNEEEDKGMDRDAIANELFDADDVSNFIPFFLLLALIWSTAFLPSRTKNNPKIFSIFFSFFFHVAYKNVCLRVCYLRYQSLWIWIDKMTTTKLTSNHTHPTTHAISATKTKTIRPCIKIIICCLTRRTCVRGKTKNKHSVSAIQNKSIRTTNTR